METIVNDLQLLRKRDLLNFLKIRTAHTGDDYIIGELLVRSFRETYKKKLPDLITTQEREGELRNVAERRASGVVRVIELGYQAVGTYGLVPPSSNKAENWLPDTATLRCLAVDPDFHSLKLSELLLQDAVKIGKSWNLKNICLHVQKGADGVARLYERFGFHRAIEGDRVLHGSKIEGYLLDLCQIGGKMNYV